MEDVFAAIDQLSFTAADFIVAGSVPLLLHGLRDGVQDLDLVARGLAWRKVANIKKPTSAPFDGALKVDLEVNGISIEVLDRWFPRIFGPNIDNLIHSAEIVNNVNFMPLGFTLTWKESLGRDKDVEDVKSIKNYLTKRS